MFRSFEFMGSPERVHKRQTPFISGVSVSVFDVNIGIRYFCRYFFTSVRYMYRYFEISRYRYRYSVFCHYIIIIIIIIIIMVYLILQQELDYTHKVHTYYI